MEKKFKHSKKLLGILIILLSFLSFSNSLHSQCTDYCSAYSWYYYWDDYIYGVQFGDIDNWTDNYGYADYTYYSTYVETGKTYDLYVYLAYGYGHMVMAYIDWNSDCDFDDTDEQISLSTDDYYNYYASVKVPADAIGGQTRMRIRNDYDWDFVGACWGSYYGEIEDYTIDIALPKPDGTVTDVFVPLEPFAEGTYDISAEISNVGEGDMGSCTVNWEVNGNYQTPYYWSGQMAKDKKVKIPLGQYDFIYPDGGPYDPFTVRVWVSDVLSYKGYQYEDNYDNNEFSKSLAPSTEDAEPVAIAKPSGGFTPGVTPVAIQIRNNARKVLQSCDVEWFVDGVSQGTVSWSGYLYQGETADVDVGSFNFQYKTPLVPFNIKAITSKPNGVIDPIPGNDVFMGKAAPSLIPGSYTIGGDKAHFPTITSAFEYMNLSGIVGDGNVFLKINSGDYDEQVMLGSIPHGNNNFFIESVTGNPEDVRINFSPDQYTPYVLAIIGLDDVYIRNLTFNVKDAGASLAMYIGNLSNFECRNVIFNGVKGGNTIQHSLVYLNDVYDARFFNCTFRNGYHGIYSYYFVTEPTLTIKNNKFIDYLANAIYTEYDYYGSGGKAPKKANGTKIQAGLYPIIVEDNDFTGIALNPRGGIVLTNAALVQNNKFSNFSSNIPGYYAISLSTPVDNGIQSTVKNNMIMNMNGTSGIQIAGINNVDLMKNSVFCAANNLVAPIGLTLTGSNLNVTYNKISVDGTLLKSKGVYSYSAQGTIADNLFFTKNGPAYEAISNFGLYTYYNTIVSYSNFNSTALFDYGINSFNRNVLVNYGTGKSVINNNSTIYSSSNLLYTKGASNAADLANWQNSTNDWSSSNVAVELLEDGTYKFAKFYPEALSNSPIDLPNNLESIDYFGKTRNDFYIAGYATITLDLKILKQPASIMACNGTSGQSLFCAADISYGAKASYQWQRDGVNIPGATEASLNLPTFTYETSGVYRCFIGGPANLSKGTYSDEAIVYTLRQTEITKPPLTQTASVGGTAFFELEVHIKGIVPPYFQHKYQWWRHYKGNEVQLMDNEYFANTRSPIMTITNIQDLHFSGSDDYYYCIVEGLCGKVTSNPVKLLVKSGEFMFTVQPQSQDVCLGGELNLSASAYVVGGTDPVGYKWYFKGYPLSDDARITGSQTSYLKITNLTPADEGVYYSEVISYELDKTTKSNNAGITLSYPPTIDKQPTDQTLKLGENLKLSVVASGFAPLTYQWYKDDTKIIGATTPNFEIQGVTLNHNGFYYCSVTNKCGTVNSARIQVIVNKDGGISSVTDANSINMQVTPNPAISDISISFNLLKDAQVEIAILDLTGKKVASKFANAVSGDNNVVMSLGHNVVNGTYFVQVIEGASTYTRQIIVKK